MSFHRKFGDKEAKFYFSFSFSSTAYQSILLFGSSQAHAQEAAKKVKIVYEDLPAILSIPQAIEAKSYFHVKTLQQGNTAAGFAASDHVLEGEMHLGGQEHFYLETQVGATIVLKN
jgi:xanthine dehydrogenase/oxidase